MKTLTTYIIYVFMVFAIIFIVSSCHEQNNNAETTNQEYRELLEIKNQQKLYLEQIMESNEIKTATTRNYSYSNPDLSIDELDVSQNLKAYLQEYIDYYILTNDSTDNALLLRISNDNSIIGEERVLFAEIIGNGEYIRNNYPEVFISSTRVSKQECLDRYNSASQNATTKFVISYALSLAGGAASAGWFTAIGVAYSVASYANDLNTIANDYDWCLKQVK